MRIPTRTRIWTLNRNPGLNANNNGKTEKNGHHGNRPVNISLGYTLQRVETLDWGNLRGWQPIELSLADGGSRLSLIAGINGSGKSTIIDGIMTVLLPFKQLLQLGVTHDFEEGRSGSRNVDDYLLGKHAATGGDAVEDDQVYSRDTGVSCILLVFRHNENPERWLSLARVWWYAGRKIREDSANIIARENLTIGASDARTPEDEGGGLFQTPRLSLCDDAGHMFASLAAMKRGLPQKSDRIQVFDRVNQYFETLRKYLGGVSKEDLRMLNRAFYMKSIGHIDRFIREHMLTEMEHESIHSLIQHVKQAAEISRDIARSEERVVALKVITGNLRTFREHQIRIEACRLEIRLLRIYEKWAERRDIELELTKLGHGIETAEAQLPGLRQRVDDAERESNKLQQELNASEGILRLERLKDDRKNLEKDMNLMRRERETVEERCVRLGLERPKSFEGLPAFREAVKEVRSGLVNEAAEFAAHQKQVHIREGELRTETERVRGEIEFLSKNRTVIDEQTYRIKTRCFEELGLSNTDLMFVGELIRVKADAHQYRRAVESVLAPISRNLLCAPHCLDDVTEWLNRTQLRRTVVMKRIRSEELEARPAEKAAKDSILNRIELRPREDHPFYDYLWNWLRAEFYHRVVGVEELRSSVDRAVTVEGLVKSDRRTQRKYKEKLEYSLGWDSRERQAELVRNLNALQREDEQIRAENAALEERRRDLSARERDADDLLKEAHEYLGLPEHEERYVRLEQEILVLERDDTDLNALRELAEESKRRYGMRQRELVQLEQNLEHDQRNREKLTNERADLESIINDRLGVPPEGDRRPLREAVPDWEERLKSIQQILSVKNLQVHEYEREIESEINSRTLSRNNTHVRDRLKNYQEDHHDPNLPADFHPETVTVDGIDRFLEAWNEALERLESTGLPAAREKWTRFYNDTLIDAIKAAVNEIRTQQREVETNIASINSVLRGVDFERLPEGNRYLKIEAQRSNDTRVRRFLKDVKEVEGVLAGDIRGLGASENAKQTMAVLEPFVESLTEDPNYQAYVVDVRNHRTFQVHSLRRNPDGEDVVVERFAGARTDSKSSAQTAQLAYTLLASSLAYRFHFHTPARGQDSLRLIILDEFTSKFDNEKPHDVIRLLTDMGFQALLVSPLDKADLLAEHINRLVFVFKVSAEESKAYSHPIRSRKDYDRLMENARQIMRAGQPAGTERNAGA